MVAIVVSGLVGALGGRSEAALILSVDQVGADVVITGSGSANLAALTLAINIGQYNAVIFPSGPALLVGATGTQSSDDYQSISGRAPSDRGGSPQPAPAPASTSA